MDIVTYALLIKMIKGLASGVKSATVQGTSIVFTMNDGSKQTITFPTPADGVSITDVDVNADKHLIVKLSDNRTIDAGLVPTVKGDTGSKGKDGINGKNGADGADGIDGVSPTVTITEATGRHTVSITDKDGVHSFVVKDGSALDVDNYYTKDEANSLLNGKADKADIPTVPTNLSELTNDENFIKNTVDNLTNYYKKNETYTQEEINELISNLNKLTTQIVENLPTENIDTSTIYLVKQGETNNYMQYMYIKSAWAELGSTEVNLSSYVTLTKMNEELDKKADKSEIPTVPTKVSAFTNDVGYLTEYTETDPTVPAWAKSPTKPSYSAEEIGALPDDTEIPIFTNKEVLDKISAEKVADWDEAATSAHTHGNKDTLDKFSENDEGKVLYDNKPLASDNLWHGTQAEYDALGEYDENKTYVITDSNEEADLSEVVIDDTSTTATNKTWSASKISSIKNYTTVPLVSFTGNGNLSSTVNVFWDDSNAFRQLITGVTVTRWRYIFTGASVGNGALTIGNATIPIVDDQVGIGASYPHASNWVTKHYNKLVTIGVNLNFYPKELSIQIEYICQ